MQKMAIYGNLYALLYLIKRCKLASLFCLIYDLQGNERLKVSCQGFSTVALLPFTSFLNFCCSFFDEQKLTERFLFFTSSILLLILAETFHEESLSCFTKTV